MIYIFFAIWLIIGAAVFVAPSRRIVHLLCGLYMAVHALFAALITFGGNYQTTSGVFFTFDEAGTLFYLLLGVVATFVLIHSQEYLKEDSVVYSISFNGKTRFTMELAADMDNAAIQETVLANENTQKYIDGKTIRKVIVVPKKIVNIVI